MASPASWPGYHARRVAGTSSSHGRSIGEPQLRTTTVRGFAAANSSHELDLARRKLQARTVPTFGLRLLIGADNDHCHVGRGSDAFGLRQQFGIPLGLTFQPDVGDGYLGAASLGVLFQNELVCSTGRKLQLRLADLRGVRASEAVHGGVRDDDSIDHEPCSPESRPGHPVLTGHVWSHGEAQTDGQLLEVRWPVPVMPDIEGGPAALCQLWGTLESVSVEELGLHAAGPYPLRGHRRRSTVQICTLGVDDLPAPTSLGGL